MMRAHTSRKTPTNHLLLPFANSHANDDEKWNGGKMEKRRRRRRRRRGKEVGVVVENGSGMRDNKQARTLGTKKLWRLTTNTGRKAKWMKSEGKIDLDFIQGLKMKMEIDEWEKERNSEIEIE